MLEVREVYLERKDLRIDLPGGGGLVGGKTGADGKNLRTSALVEILLRNLAKRCKVCPEEKPSLLPYGVWIIRKAPGGALTPLPMYKPLSASAS